MHAVTDGRRVRYLAIFASIITSAAMIVGGLWPAGGTVARAADAAPPAPQGRATALVHLGLTFSGAQSCAGSGCHNQSPQKSGFLMNELATWQEQDPHTKAMS